MHTHVSPLGSGRSSDFSSGSSLGSHQDRSRVDPTPKVDLKIGLLPVNMISVDHVHCAMRSVAVATIAADPTEQYVKAGNLYVNYAQRPGADSPTDNIDHAMPVSLAPLLVAGYRNKTRTGDDPVVMVPRHIERKYIQANIAASIGPEGLSAETEQSALLLPARTCIRRLEDQNLPTIAGKSYRELCNELGNKLQENNPDSILIFRHASVTGKVQVFAITPGLAGPEVRDPILPVSDTRMVSDQYGNMYSILTDQNIRAKSEQGIDPRYPPLGSIQVGVLYSGHESLSILPSDLSRNSQVNFLERYGDFPVPTNLSGSLKLDRPKMSISAPTIERLPQHFSPTQSLVRISSPLMVKEPEYNRLSDSTTCATNASAMARFFIGRDKGGMGPNCFLIPEGALIEKIDPIKLNTAPTNTAPPPDAGRLLAETAVATARAQKEAAIVVGRYTFIENGKQGRGYYAELYVIQPSDPDAIAPQVPIAPDDRDASRARV